MFYFEISSGIYLNAIHLQIKDDEAAQTYADLYYAAEKYDINDIRELCKHFMIVHCHQKNIRLLLKTAKLYNFPELETKCKKIFADTTYTYLTMNSYIRLEFDDEIFSEFLSLEQLSVWQEFDLYIALEAMVDNKDLPTHLKCLSKIRFLTMESDDAIF